VIWGYSHGLVARFPAVQCQLAVGTGCHVIRLVSGRVFPTGVNHLEGTLEVIFRVIRWKSNAPAWFCTSMSSSPHGAIGHQMWLFWRRPCAEDSGLQYCNVPYVLQWPRRLPSHSRGTIAGVLQLDHRHLPILRPSCGIESRLYCRDSRVLEQSKNLPGRARK
jgi:hypothetical protein